MPILPVILSGGSGTRLWPLSREQYPKQFLPLVGEESLLQATARRLDGMADLLDPLIVCNDEHRFVVSEQLRLVGKRPSLLLEPVGRNTAPALTMAALWALRSGHDPVMVVMPADHVIPDRRAFLDAVALAVAAADDGYAVTFGISPEWPETGYGYIQRGEALTGANTVFALGRFVEKPDWTTAHAYVDSGDYLWNSGIFVMRASTWRSAIGLCRPDILSVCEDALPESTNDGPFVKAEEKTFSACPSQSIDCAVMERLAADVPGLPKAAVIPLSAGWSDVGAWDAFWQVSEKDDAGNAVRGDVLLHETTDTLAFSESRLVCCIGVRDLVVVETPDAILVADKSRTQEVRKIAEQMKQANRNEARMHRKVDRPWGSYDGVDAGDRFQVKRIVVKPGASLSLQMHHHRAEHWIVVRGTAKVTCGDKVMLVSENESTYIPLGMKHRLENPGKMPLEMIEVQSGSYLGEDDIVRFDDHYGRHGGEKSVLVLRQA